MRNGAIGLLVKPLGLLAISLVVPFATLVVPAQAQDIFGLFKVFGPPISPVPTQPFEYHPDAAIERPRRKVQRRPKPVPTEQAASKTPENLKAPGEIANPVPALLTDSTLRPGDMVMFPDGLRVFTGQPGNQHKLAAFKPLSQAGKAVSKATHKLVANLRASENSAWTTDGFKSGGKLAVNSSDIVARSPR